MASEDSARLRFREKVFDCGCRAYYQVGIDDNWYDGGGIRWCQESPSEEHEKKVRKGFEILQADLFLLTANTVRAKTIT